MKVIQLNHVGLHVADIPASVDFYANVLGLTQLHRPEFDFEGAWFDLGEGRELHLIGGRTQDPVGARRGNHVAFAVDDFDAAVSHIERHNVPHHPPQTRPDGARQLFIRDPDGHYVELCDVTCADASKRTKWP